MLAVKVVAECLGRSQSIATQDVARQLLHQLAVVCGCGCLHNLHNYIP